MHQPADVSGELLRLRARQHHAVIERVQKTLLGNPALLLNQFAVHDRNLPRRSAKTDETQLKPEAQCVAK